MSTVTVVAWATFAASMLASGGHVGKKIVLRVDTGVQHCNGLGQEIKRYGKVTAKTGFYFTGDRLHKRAMVMETVDT